jgi:hypothetical protein
MTSEPLAHFYHLYADGEYLPAVERHVTALVDSGLQDALDKFHVCAVGSKDNCVKAIEFVKDCGGNPTHVSLGVGWEQFTLERLIEHAKAWDGFTLYCHTKGAANHSEINELWRESMTVFMVDRWREAVERLADHDTVGTHLIYEGLFWGGNFWWGCNWWLRNLPPLQYDSRYHAESWIGHGEGRRYDMNPGWPDPSRFVRKP